jgi:Zn-finger nucleic acid-binding protein
MMAVKTPFVEATAACGNCRAPMQRLTLAGHYGMPVELDLCPDCHLVWFDETESARLGGQGLLTLIGRMAEAQSLAHQPLRPDVRCPRCSGGLATVHNQTRWGRSLQLKCTVRHGAYQSFAQLLQEKGLLRPMSQPDRHRLLGVQGRIDCVNCGAAIGLADAECGHCRSVASLFDVARLAHALDPEDALAPQAVNRTAAQQAAMQCEACGTALRAGESIGCAQCGATLAVSRLADVKARLDELAPALRAHALKPAPEVVKRRLAALAADVPRRRAWIADMQADAAHQQEQVREEFDWTSMWSAGTNPLRAVFIALLLWFVWYFLGRD